MNLVRQLRYESPPHLPPPCRAPILENYDIETRRVAAAHQLSAPIDERGIVDIYKTVETAMQLVDPEYVWPRDEPRPDIHHFVWERDSYHPRHFDGSRIPRDYREIPFHKGYLPRQLHDFIHATIAPPPVPEFEVMRRRTEAYESAKALFLAARLAISVNRKPYILKGVERSETGELLLEHDILMSILERMRDEFANRKGRVTPDNEFIADVDLSEAPMETVARHLGRIAAHDGVNLFPLVYGGKRAA